MHPPSISALSNDPIVAVEYSLSARKQKGGTCHGLSSSVDYATHPSSRLHVQLSSTVIYTRREVSERKSKTVRTENYRCAAISGVFWGDGLRGSINCVPLFSARVETCYWKGNLEYGIWLLGTRESYPSNGDSNCLARHTFIPRWGSVPQAGTGPFMGQSRRKPSGSLAIEETSGQCAVRAS